MAIFRGSRYEQSTLEDVAVRQRFPDGGNRLPDEERYRRDKAIVVRERITWWIPRQKVGVSTSARVVNDRYEAIEYSDYIVREGDRLETLAYLAYGDPKAWHLIARANAEALDPNSSLQVGQLLRIPRVGDISQIRAVQTRRRGAGAVVVTGLTSG